MAEHGTTSAPGTPSSSVRTRPWRGPDGTGFSDVTLVSVWMYGPRKDTFSDSMLCVRRVWCRVHTHMYPSCPSLSLICRGVHTEVLCHMDSHYTLHTEVDTHTLLSPSPRSSFLLCDLRVPPSSVKGQRVHCASQEIQGLIRLKSARYWCLPSVSVRPTHGPVPLLILGYLPASGYTLYYKTGVNKKV